MIFYAENVKEFIYKNLDEIENDLRNGNMPFSGIISYDEEFIWIKHPTLRPINSKLIRNSEIYYRRCNYSTRVFQCRITLNNS